MTDCLVLLPYPGGRAPAQRYRMEQWLPFLAAAGIRCDVRELLTGAELDLLHSPVSLVRKVTVLTRSLRRALASIPARRRYDVVWMHRTLLLGGPAWIESLLAWLGPPVVYDFDDAIWVTKTVAANRLIAFLKFSGKTATICRKAAAVVVGTEALAEYARTYNADVTVVPSTVDVDTYTPVPPRSRGPIVLGYSGSPTTIEYLDDIAPVIRRLAETVPLELHVMGAEFALPGVKVVTVPWSVERELRELRSYDIGLMPLADDPWTRGKGGMKGLLYMSVGVPVVASPVGAAPGFIEHERNGLLCCTDDEWLFALRRLAGDPELRHRLGAAGRETVVARYSPQVQVPRMVEVLSRVAARGHRA